MKIGKALVMCGGNGTQCDGIEKPFVMYRGKTILSYALCALQAAGVKQAVLVAKEKNADAALSVAERCGLEATVVLPPKRFREAIRDCYGLLPEPFYLIAGNQPLSASYLESMRSLHTGADIWVVSLYESSLAKEQVLVSQDADGILRTDGSRMRVLQHPFIITRDIVALQEREGFSFTIEGTITRALAERKVKGVIAEMPPEFDTPEMLLATLQYAKRLDSSFPRQKQ